MPTPLSLMAFWNRHKAECRAVGAIMDDARRGKLPGVEPAGRGFDVVDEDAALAAMRRHDT